MGNNFNPLLAIKAQEKFCGDGPNFAPRNGICYRCHRNIYLPTNGNNGSVRGITVEEAGKKRITGCPHCNYSFVE